MNLEILLDNPIWNAGMSNNHLLAYQIDDFVLFKREVAWFAAMKEYASEGFQQLHTHFEIGDHIILFTQAKQIVPKGWKVILERPLVQMVYHGEVIRINDDSIRPLGDLHVDQMLSLTALTKPGPFFSKTIQFGDYYGIFEQDQLVSMAGSRLSFGNYTEISAVCTHPQFVGRGLAGKLIQNQIEVIQSKGMIPFLHAYSDNPALSLYHKLGFVLRKELIVYRLEKTI